MLSSREQKVQMAGRRTTNDKQWQETKKIVVERDRGDRMLRCLSMPEALALKRKAGSYLQQLDPAHIIAVGDRPDLCYEPLDICLLNHYSHSNLDDCKDPITGKPITLEERDRWWYRIASTNKQQKQFLDDQNFVYWED